MWNKLWWLNSFYWFLCEESSYLDPKGFCYSYASSCCVCKGGTFFHDWSLEKFKDSYLSFRITLLQSVSYFLSWSPPSSLCTVFDAISFTINNILSVNLSANVFVFKDFNIYNKDWLTNSCRTDRPGDCYNFVYNLKQPYSGG